jgi:hypothetical protein
MKVKVKNIYYKLFIIWLSFQWIFKINIGDLVSYKKKLYVLIQGVENPYWDLIRYDNKDIRIYHVHINQFKKIKTLRNYYNSFTSGYHFYMRYWYDIWCREGIKDWMRNTSIWQRKQYYS